VQRTYATGLDWDRVVSPTLITQVRLGIAYYNNVAKRTGYGKATSTGIGIPGVNINDFTSGMFTINLGGYTTPIFSFIADQWQVSSRLTASIGLRWELYKPMTPEHPGGFSNYIPSDTLVIAGVGNNPSNLGMTFYKHYLASRVGLAFLLTGGKYGTVLRTGFGLSFTPFPDNTYAYNYPVRSITST